MDNAYKEYMAALDACIAIAKQRALKQIDGATDTEMMALDRQYLRATAVCHTKREAWVRLRDARLEPAD
jgi:hypothetical protein